MPTLFAKQKRELRDKWIHEHGYVCPGYRRPPHKAHPRYNPLTVDHIRPRSKRGSDNLHNLTILCRRCNSSKKDRPASTITRGPSFPHPLRQD